MDKDRLDQIGIIDFARSFSQIFSQSMSIRIVYPEVQSGNITYYELIVLCTILSQFGPKTVMEFGTFNGRTTLNLSLNNGWGKDGHIWTVDLPKGVRTQLPLADGKHDPNDELGYIGHTTKLFMNSPTPLPTPVTQIWSDTAQLKVGEFEDKIDFLFIDASHSYENALNDSYIGQRIVKEGGVIAWHDYNGWPGVTKAVNQFQDDNPHMQLYWINDTSIAIGVNKKARR